MIEMLMEGELQSVKEQDSFREMWKQIAQKHKVKWEDFHMLLTMEVCPEGVIECSFEDKFVSIAAQTNVAGPGFHACVASIYDDILLDSGLSFQVNDPTGYYEKRDFEELKYRYFYPWLRTIADYVLEHKQQANMCLCWSFDDYEPLGKDGYVVTPLGYMAIEEFEKEDSELAQSFFIWHNQKRDAHFYRNCAYALLWKECFFDYSAMNAYSASYAHKIIDYLEAAYDKDNLLTLPYDLYSQLCQVMGREELLHGQAAPRKMMIGYRQELVFYSVGNFKIACMGVAEKSYDSVMDTLNIMAPYKQEDAPWSWLIKASAMPHEQGESSYFPCFENAQTIPLTFTDMQGKACIQKEDDYYRMDVQINKEKECLYVEAIACEEVMLQEILQWLSLSIYQKKAEESLKH